MDYREELYSEVTNKIILTNEFTPDQINILKDIFVKSLYSYDVTERCTAVTTYDASSDNIIKLYLGSLATERYSPDTIKEYNFALHKFSDSIGKSLINANIFDLRIWIGDLGKTLSPRTLHNYRTYVCGFYKWCFKEGLIDKDRMDKMKPIKYPEVMENPYSESDIDKLRKACKNLREECEILLLFSTGARVSEIANLKICDIDFDTREVRIIKGKGDKPRITYMSGICCEYLKKYISERKIKSSYVLVNRLGNPMNRGTIAADMRRLAKRSGVTNVHAHRFRKTFASEMKRRGGDITVIQKLLGHASLDTTMKIYVNMSNDSIRYDYMMHS